MSFLGTFSASFLAALRWWPALAFVLTLPILIARVAMRRRLTWAYLIASYAVVLYVLGLGFFTLYPMPDDAIAYCATHHTRANLQPLTSIAEGLTANRSHTAFQVLANIAFFVPLGAFWWAIVHGRFLTATAVGVGTSLLIETAQLTGIFGLYPCSFRLLDVDDLLVNTLGAMLGYLLARFLGVSVGGGRFTAPAVRPTLSNRTLAGVVDLLVVMVTVAMTHVALYPWVSDAIRRHLYLGALTGWCAILFGVVPWLARGTVGQLLVGLRRLK